MGFAGCSKEKTTQSDAMSPNVQIQKNEKVVSASGKNIIAGLAPGFPAEIPFYDGATVIESDNFNGNNYTVIYNVTAAFADVLDYYLSAFALDESGAGNGVAYYEAFDFNNVFVKGLTIEDTGSGTTVFMVLEDTRQASSEEDDYGEDSDGTIDSDITTYETAKEITLNSNYPQDAVPLPEGIKVIGCSMVPDSRSGFVDLIAPANAFDEVVSFYTSSLGVTPQTSATVVMQAAHFKGEIDDIKLSIMVSRLLTKGNDTLIQITVNEE